jgi:alpha-galactosidase
MGARAKESGGKAMAHKIVLIGAGSAQFGFGTLTDLFRSEVLVGSEIVLHDINPTSLARVEKVGRQYIAEYALPYTLSATTSRAEALAGASFCISSIEVGNRFELWEMDWHIPLQYGIRQVYGENGGPGGLFHSLRIIPPILAICGDIMRYCPDAHVFNFSNPMTRICLTAKRKYPQIKLTGLCHEIAALERHLPRVLGIPFEDMDVCAAGLNHFTFLLSARARATGADLYGEIRAKAPAYLAGLAEHGLIRELLARYGYLPVTSDSHTGEYVQWAWDCVDHKGILDFYAFYKRYCAEKQPTMGAPSGERVVPIIEGIVTNSGQAELAVNVMNTGLIANLPGDMVVEVPAIVDAQGVHGQPVGALPKGLAALMLNQCATYDLTSEAILTGSRELALQALLADPVVDSVRAAEQTLEVILERQHEYLSYLH